MRPIRVAFLQASLGIGGAERLTQNLVQRMPRDRVDPVAIHLYQPGPIGAQLAADGIETASGLAGGPLDAAVGGRLAAAYERLRIELVYTTDSALPLFWAGWRRRRAPRPALVVGFHSTGKHDDFLQHLLANGSALPVADRLVALAGMHRDFLARTLRLDPRRFEVIPNGVDTTRFSPGDRDAARQSAGLPGGAPLAGIVAALRPEKDHALFLHAAARVRARLPEARFAVVGDGPARAGLERLAATLGLGEAVRFLGAREDVPQVMRALDAVVLSSRPVVETFPLTLLEALACGVPVVSTAVGSVPEFVPDGEVGFVVPPGDAGALAECIARLLVDPPRRAAMGRAGRALVERRYTIEATVDAYAALFERLARPGGAP